MSRLLFLSRAEVAGLLPDVQAQLDLVERSYRALAAGRVELPPKPGVHPRKDSFLHAMPAYLRDEDVAEVMVNGPNSIWLERGGRTHRTNASGRPIERRSSVLHRIIALALDHQGGDAYRDNDYEGIGEQRRNQPRRFSPGPCWRCSTLGPHA